MKRTIFMFAILMLFCSSAIADEPWIKESEAQKIMEKQIKEKYETFEQIGGIQFVYPYGYGIPEYIGYFKVTKNIYKSILLVYVNALTKKVYIYDYGFPSPLAEYFDIKIGQKKNSLLSDEYLDTFQIMITQFLDTNFVRTKVESMLGKRIKIIHLVKCGGRYPYLDCIGIANIFWVIIPFDDEEYFFQRGRSNWILLPAYEYIQDNIFY